MIIQIDSREKARAIQKIITEFDLQGVKHPVSKLWIGDYMSYDSPRLVIDRKQNLLEVCSNITHDHERFQRELTRAQENGIKIIFLVEHGKDIKTLADVIWWVNPRSTKRVKNSDGKWEIIKTKATTGEALYKMMCTLERKYGCEFQFCTKEETGKRIIEILGGNNDSRGD